MDPLGPVDPRSRTYGLGESHAPFHAMAELKKTALEKILMSQILIRKRGYQIFK